MAKGQESDIHRVMLEALELRLRKLFPESKVTLGKKIQPIGLKPDIYIEHADGRKWAYEMIYGNKSAEHTLDNHQQYRNAGIHDFWILWDRMAPRTEPLAPDQGLLEEFVATKKRAKSTKLLQALASIHSEYSAIGRTVLYAFALDGLDGLIENPHRAMQIISTGITIYQVDDFVAANKYLEYSSDFISILELDFNEHGYIKLSDESADGTLQEALLKSLGVDEQAKNFPIPYLKNLNQILFNLPATVLEEVTKIYAEKILKDATSDEIQELQQFMVSGGAAKFTTLFAPSIPKTSATALIENAEGIEAIAEFLKKLQQAMEDAGIPMLLRKMVDLALAPPKWKEIADVMRWQENSEAVQHIQNIDFKEKH